MTPTTITHPQLTLPRKPLPVRQNQRPRDTSGSVQRCGNLVSAPVLFVMLLRSVHDLENGEYSRTFRKTCSSHLAPCIPIPKHRRKHKPDERSSMRPNPTQVPTAASRPTHRSTTCHNTTTHTNQEKPHRARNSTRRPSDKGTNDHPSESP